MARYTGPKSKIARKFGEPIFGADKAFEKKNYPPGAHGQNKRSSNHIRRTKRGCRFRIASLGRPFTHWLWKSQPWSCQTSPRSYQCREARFGPACHADATSF